MLNENDSELQFEDRKNCILTLDVFGCEQEERSKSTWPRSFLLLEVESPKGKI